MANFGGLEIPEKVMFKQNAFKKLVITCLDVIQYFFLCDTRLRQHQVRRDARHARRSDPYSKTVQTGLRGNCALEITRYIQALNPPG